MPKKRRGDFFDCKLIPASLPPDAIYPRDAHIFYEYHYPAEKQKERCPQTFGKKAKAADTAR